MTLKRPDGLALVVVDSPMPTIVAMTLFAALLCALARHVIVGRQASVGIVFATAPIALLMLLWPLTLRRAVFTFDLARGELAWRRRSLLGGEAGAVPLGDIRAADVETLAGERRQSSHRLRLLLYDGTVLPITGSFPAGPIDRAQRIADAINRFLEEP